jgi:hypothetical protein
MASTIMTGAGRVTQSFSYDIDAVSGCLVLVCTCHRYSYKEFLVKNYVDAKCSDLIVSTF